MFVRPCLFLYNNLNDRYNRYGIYLIDQNFQEKERIANGTFN